MHRESKRFLVWILVTSRENQQYTILAFAWAYLIMLIELIIADKKSSWMGISVFTVALKS